MVGSAVRDIAERENGVVAWCLELHDLWIAKAIANREKDRRFCRALVDMGSVDAAVLQRRLAQVKQLTDSQRALVETFIRSAAGP